MFVQKIEISGFKSFAKKTILDFSAENNFKSGVTCVVGPNGSGKSNVSDALRWVIGEKSIKNLRGSNKEDVIFAGSSNKAKLGCAQVSVFFDNTSKRFDIDYDQVIITRKIYRDGENHYLINNSKVKLFDLISLLSQAGIGHGNYTIVNQGMTDQILLASQQDRMGFLEDAAGVKEFQLKKMTSLRRIKKTKRNIEKTSSLMREIEPELKILKIQSRKIEKSQKIREMLIDRRRQYFAVKLNGLEKKQKDSNLELDNINKQLLDREKIIEKIKKELRSSNDDSIKAQNELIKVIEKEKRVLENKRYELERAGFRQEAQQKDLQEEIKQLDEEEIILVDKNYILSKLDNFKKELDKFKGKSITASLVAIITDLVKEIQAGKAVKKKVGKEIEDKKIKLSNELSEALKTIELNLLEIKDCRGEIIQKSQEIQEINQEIREKQELRVDFKDKLRREQFEVEKAQKYMQHLNFNKNKLREELEAVKKDIRNNFRGQIEDIRAVSCQTNIEALKLKIEKLNWQLEQIKEIDESVVVEYREIQDKYNFLEKESKDLELTLIDLSHILVEMDRTIEKRLNQAFLAINKEFSIYFKLMFSGGTAKLEKVRIEKRRTNDNFEDSKEEQLEGSNEYGIDIKVNPPGKRINNLSMLSGGERTLTSIALLFALISYNPPPFAFLDEIEANLDEANANKFSRILKRLSHKTQFILATHSREVMRMADILYGITMDKKDGYSKVFSVELGQIKNDRKGLTNTVK